MLQQFRLWWREYLMVISVASIEGYLLLRMWEEEITFWNVLLISAFLAIPLLFVHGWAIQSMEDEDFQKKKSHRMPQYLSELNLSDKEQENFWKDIYEGTKKEK